LTEVRKKRRKRKEVASPEEVLELMTQIMRGEAGDEHTGPPKLAERSKAAELLGKRYGLFGEKEGIQPAGEEVTLAIDAAMKEMMDKYEQGGP